jgi:DNA-binding SARP family transcriptional activator
VPADPDGVVEQPGSTAPVPSTAAPPTAKDDPPEADHAPPPAAGDGLDLPGGYLPWSLATAIAAAAAAAWLHRRRRHLPGQHAPEPDLPEPVTEVHRQVLRRRPSTDSAGRADLAERAAAVPDLPAAPPGGVGLVGDGAHAAARAVIVSALASGGPADPDRRSEVVIDAATWTALFATEPPEPFEAAEPDTWRAWWPRLRVAADFDQALSMLDARMLHRARILDEHTVDRLDALRARAPDEEALPPVLLVAHAPAPAAGHRAKVTLALGASLDISAYLLGAWEHGSTIEVSADGHTRPRDGTGAAPGDRLALLDVDTAAAVLATLYEAHTGQPPLPPGTQGATAVHGMSAVAGAAGPADDRPARPVIEAPAQPGAEPVDTRATETAADAAAEPAAGSPAVELVPPSPQAASAETPRAKARLRVLGTPRVEDIGRPGRPLRAKAAELAVYLACHPDGADTASIVDHVLPDARMRAARQQVHTNASNLRHVLGRAAGPLPGGYVLKRGPSARYRLDPAAVEVDLWRLRDLLVRAPLAGPPARTAMLREACDLYTAPLADGCHYDWVEPYREQARRWATEAHLLLAEDLLESDPQTASEVLDKAIGLDRYNEALYRKAMHARHALGDADGIRALLRALTKALADLDTEPAEATTALAVRLRTSLRQR